MLSQFTKQIQRTTALQPLTQFEVKSFAAKKKKAKSNAGDVTEYESDQDAKQKQTTPEPFVQQKTRSQPVPVDQSHLKDYQRQTVVLDLAKQLFQPFSLGDIKKVQSTPGDKAPSSEDTIEGRYAGVLFTTASQRGALYDVYEDMMYLSELYTHSESFRLFTENQGVGQKEIKLLNGALLETAPFHETTLHFLTVLAENKRLIQIKTIAHKYQKLYQQFNKEEKITIISAETLTTSQKNDVLKALQANPQNNNKVFTIEYQVDASIQGGLQMYTESEFMDMSLQSRVARINEEVAKLSL